MKDKTVFLDFDDTLVVESDSAEKSLAAASEIAARKYGIPASEMLKQVRKRAREFWHALPTIGYAKRIGVSSWEALWADFSGPEENTELAEMKKLAPEFRSRVWNAALEDFGTRDRALADEMSLFFMTDRGKRHLPYPETVEVLETLRNGYRLGLITNGAPGLQWLKIRASGLEKYFEHIVVSGDIGTGKPDPEIFRTAMKLFGINENGCVMAGDSPGSDILGANRAGIRSVWVNRTGRDLPPEARPDAVISDLGELPGIVSALFTRTG